MVKHLMVISILALFFYLSAGSHAATFNVTTPAEFQTALTTAQANGQNDTIYVSAGTYTIASTLTYDTAQNFDLNIVGVGASATILDGGESVQIMKLTGSGDGDISISGLTLQRGRNGDVGALGGALFANNSANGSITIDRCIVKNSTSVKNTGGAWIGAVNGDLTVTNSSFTHNSCDIGTADDGCGLYLYFDSATAAGNAVVCNNDISYNTLNTNPHPIGNCDGAGLMIYHLGTSGPGHAFTIENNTINNNLSYEGVAGMSLHLLHPENTIFITGNTFSENISGPIPSGMTIQISGAGAHVYSEGGNITINNNQFLDNVNHDPFGLGAGLCLDNMPRGTLQMIGNVFAGNQNNGIGGGLMVLSLGDDVASANIVQNLFVNNQAGLIDGSGGGLSLGSSVDVNLINNTFYNNSAPDGGGMTFYAEAAADVASLFNEIYRSNTPNAISVFSAGAVQAAYSNIESGSGEAYFGTGCIDSNPFFLNTANPPGADGIYATTDDGLRLGPGSPSINTGLNAAVPGTVTTDIAGQTRIQGGTVDMGAYESQSIVYVETHGLCGGKIPCFSTVQAAVDAAVSKALIRIAQGSYAEHLSLSSPKELTLFSGWNSNFTMQLEISTVNSITLSDGCMTIDRIAIE